VEASGQLHVPAGLPPGNNKHRHGNTAVKLETTDMKNDNMDSQLDATIKVY
jgi:hypothetical protein